MREMTKREWIEWKIDHLPDRLNGSLKIDGDTDKDIRWEASVEIERLRMEVDDLRNELARVMPIWRKVLKELFRRDF
jgi:hypothetical protein